MSWLDRLQPTIPMTSPEGNFFEPKWIGNERSKDKKLGLFNYPDVKGTIAQDLGVTSTKYPLTVYFDGENNDIISDDFFRAVDEKGLWTVQHPVVGGLALQLTSVGDGIQPVTSGNVRVFTCQFIEPISDNIVISTAELRNQITNSVAVLNDFASTSFLNRVSGALGNAKSSVNNAAKKVTAAIDSVLGPLKRLNDDINSAFDSITRSIESIITDITSFPGEFAGEIQNLIQLPGTIAVKTSQKLEIYANLISGLSELDGDLKETFAVKDLVLSACIGALADIASNTDAQTRTDILSQLDLISDQFTLITTQLDSDQSKVVTNRIEDQYIPLEGSYPQNLLTTAFAINFLLKGSLDLSIEKRFTLTEHKLPINITIEEYGTDELLDFFNETNLLQNEEFILLPPGREIVVFPGVVP